MLECLAKRLRLVVVLVLGWIVGCSAASHMPRSPGLSTHGERPLASSETLLARSLETVGQLRSEVSATHEQRARMVEELERLRARTDEQHQLLLNLSRERSILVEQIGRVEGRNLELERAQEELRREANDLRARLADVQFEQQELQGNDPSRTFLALRKQNAWLKKNLEEFRFRILREQSEVASLREDLEQVALLQDPGSGDSPIPSTTEALGVAAQTGAVVSQAPRVSTGSSPFLLEFWQPALLIAAVAVVLAFGVWVGRRRGGSTSVKPKAMPALATQVESSPIDATAAAVAGALREDVPKQIESARYTPEPEAWELESVQPGREQPPRRDSAEWKLLHEASVPVTDDIDRQELGADLLAELASVGEEVPEGIKSHESLTPRGARPPVPINRERAAAEEWRALATHALPQSELLPGSTTLPFSPLTDETEEESGLTVPLQREIEETLRRPEPTIPMPAWCADPTIEVSSPVTLAEVLANSFDDRDPEAGDRAETTEGANANIDHSELGDSRSGHEGFVARSEPILLLPEQSSDDSAAPGHGPALKNPEFSDDTSVVDPMASLGAPTLPLPKWTEASTWEVGDSGYTQPIPVLRRSSEDVPSPPDLNTDEYNGDLSSATDVGKGATHAEDTKLTERSHKASTTDDEISNKTEQLHRDGDSSSVR